MAFDYRTFAEGLEKAADTLAGRLTYEWQQKQEEQRVMREYTAKEKLEEARKNRELGVTLKYQKDLEAYTSDLTAQRTLEKTQYDATLNQFFGNLELMNTIQTYLKSDDPNVKMMGNSAMAIIGELREGKSISQDKHDFLTKSLPGNSFAPISELIRENEDRQLNYDKIQAQIAYDNALAWGMRNKQTPGGLQMDDVRGILTSINNTEENIAKVTQSYMYTAIEDKIDREQKLDTREEVMWNRYQEQLGTYRDSQLVLYGLLQQAQGAGKGVPGPSPEEEKLKKIIEELMKQGKPTEEIDIQKKKGPTGKELASWVKGLHAKGTEELERGKEKWEHKKTEKEPLTRVNVRQKYNIPKGVRIFTAKSLDDLKKLPGVKKNPPKTGDLVWTGTALHEIQITDGKITISKESWGKD